MRLFFYGNFELVCSSDSCSKSSLNLETSLIFVARIAADTPQPRLASAWRGVVAKSLCATQKLYI